MVEPSMAAMELWFNLRKVQGADDPKVMARIIDRFSATIRDQAREECAAKCEAAAEECRERVHKEGGVRLGLAAEAFDTAAAFIRDMIRMSERVRAFNERL